MSSFSTKQDIQHISKGRKFAAFLLAGFLCLATILSLTSCSDESTKSTTSQSEVPQITVTTSFLEDMCNVLAPDMAKVELIIPAGEDPHLYVAKPEDLDKIKNADLVLYHGLHFEGKMVDVLESTGKAVTRNFSDKDILLFDEDGKEVHDPHFWFDIDLYKQAVSAASENLQELMPEKAEEIKNNEANYLKELDALDAENKEKLEKIPRQSRILVTPHDAFGYFAHRYDLDVVAPQGVSTDSEVANSEMGKTVDTIVKNKVKAIFAESTTDPARMKKLQELVKKEGWDVEVVSGDQNELFSDSLAPKGEKGDTYLDMYRHNIDLITSHLSQEFK